MKNRLPILACTLFAVAFPLVTSVRSQTVVTFDDLPNSTTGTNIPNGYQGLSWSNFFVVNAILQSNFFGYATGANYGMVSASNVAYNGFGLPAEIDARGANFDFLSAYLTGAWNSNLNIEVQGYSDGNLIYDQTVVASATSPTLFALNYTNIDQLVFNSFGGQPAFGGTTREQFVMDNFTFEFIPEPSTFLLAALGAVSLFAFLKRKRT